MQPQLFQHQVLSPGVRHMSEEAFLMTLGQTRVRIPQLRCFQIPIPQKS